MTEIIVMGRTWINRGATMSHHMWSEDGRILYSYDGVYLIDADQLPYEVVEEICEEGKRLRERAAKAKPDKSAGDETP